MVRIIQDFDRLRAMKTDFIFRAAAAALSIVSICGCFDRKEAPREAPAARSKEEFAKCDRATLERLLLRGRVEPADMDGAFFAGLPALRELDISETAVQALPPALLDGSLPALEHLYLADCKSLKSIPAELFAKNPKLTYVNLDRSGISALPDSLGDASAIKWLRVNGTAIEKFPASLAKLRGLQRIYARKCRLEAVPAELQGMEKLEDIALDGNGKIKECPQWVADLPALKNLSLSGTGVEKLPEDLSGFKKLASLSIAGCPMTKEERHRIREALPSLSIAF